MMFEGKKVAALLLMGGIGSRFGNEIPKQFHPLLGKKVYQHPLHTMQELGYFDEILLVTHPEWVSFVDEKDLIVLGGKTRQESSYLGLKAFSTSPDIVLIHDAVRPFVSKTILINNIKTAISYGAVDTCIATSDTLVYAPKNGIIDSIPKREAFLRGQTPQTFQMDWILAAHREAIDQKIENATDDCQLILRLGKQIHIVLGDELNFKITSELDLHFANTLSKELNLKYPTR